MRQERGRSPKRFETLSRLYYKRSRSTPELQEDEDWPPFGPIETRDPEFAARLRAAGHPAILVEDDIRQVPHSSYTTLLSEEGSARDLLEEEDNLPFGTIKTRDPEFAAKLRAAGHPATLVTKENEAV